MAKAIDVPTTDNPPTLTSRRSLMAGVAGITIAGTALEMAEPSGPDAEIIALAAELCQLETDYNRLCWAADEHDHRPGKAEALAIFNAQEPRRMALQDELIDAVPQTFAGMRAKARAILSTSPEGRFSCSGEGLILSLIQDVAGETCA